MTTIVSYALFLFVCFFRWTGDRSEAEPRAPSPMRDQIDSAAALDLLETTLSKMYAIERSERTLKPDKLNPFAPRYCWEFFRPNPDAYILIGEAVKSFRGQVKWFILSANHLSCIAASQSGPLVTGYPPLDTRDRHAPSLPQFSLPTHEFIDTAISDIRKLCAHIERSLALEAASPKTFDLKSVAPPEPPLPDATEDFLERGMQVPWIVEEPRKFASTYPHTNSQSAMPLHFGLRKEELLEIRTLFSEGLPADPYDQDRLPVPSVQIAAARTQYSMLLRIHLNESAIFESQEIEALRKECLEIRTKRANKNAVRGLDKLVLMCNWAQKLHRGIYLMGP